MRGTLRRKRVGKICQATRHQQLCAGRCNCGQLQGYAQHALLALRVVEQQVRQQARRSGTHRYTLASNSATSQTLDQDAAKGAAACKGSATLSMGL